MMYQGKSVLKARLLQSVALVIVITPLASVSAGAQTANTTAANVNVLQLLSPFLALNSTSTGQQTLQTNLSQAIAVNNAAANNPTQAAQSISDKTIFGGASTSITLANGTSANYGPAANLAGGLPAQAVQGSGTIAPIQPVGGLGALLGPIFQTGVNPSAPSLTNTISLLVSSYNYTSSDLGVAKNYFANGTINGTTTAIAPTGFTLPASGGLPNRANSVYDQAYGVVNTGANQDIYGDSRPVQAVGTGTNGINGYDPTALTGLATNPSFPSGHTNYAYTDSILIGMLVPQEYTSMLMRAAAYGNSRIELGLHYPLDIIGSRAFASYDLAQAFTNASYINNATTTGTAINLPSLFNAANSELSPYLSAQCGATVATCAASSANTANDPYTSTAANVATYRANLTYGLPTLTFAQAPQEAAPSGGPDASILLATVYGGSTSAAQTIAPTGGIYGSLQTSTINQIIVNTETNALAAFYGTSLSYWSRIDLATASIYFQNTMGNLALAPSDRVTTAVTIGSGSTLGGTGAIVGATTVASGGTFAPGVYTGATATSPGTATAPGTFTINGALTFNSGSTYAVQVGATSASQTNVSGAATLGGAAVSAGFGTSGSILSKYTILTAGSLSGTFGSVTNVGGSNFTDTLSYDTTHAYLNVGINFAGTGGVSVNQQSLGNAFNRALGSNGSLPLLYATLTPVGQTQALGQTVTGAQSSTYEAMGEFASLLTTGSGIGGGATTGEPFGYADDRHQSMSVFEAVDADLGSAKTKPALAQVLNPHWAAWGQVFGGGETITGNGGLGSNTTSARVFGIAAGADTYISPTTTLGFGIGGGGTNYSLSSGLGSGHSDMFQIGATGTQHVDAAYLSGALAYGWQDATTNRTVTISGADNLQGRFRVNSLLGRAEFGNRFDYQQVGLTPYLAGQFTTLFLPSYSETVQSGASSFALSYASKTVTDPRTELGLRLDKAFAVQDGTWTLKSSVAYVYDYNTSRDVNATFQALPAASFTTNGARPAPNGALVTLGSDVKWTNGWSAGALFKGEFSGTTASYEGKGVVKYEW
jgi:uncharacterized protein with beta-barrel porin domain/membrane-associated phospholipid phosphatase